MSARITAFANRLGIRRDRAVAAAPRSVATDRQGSGTPATRSSQAAPAPTLPTPGRVGGQGGGALATEPPEPSTPAPAPSPATSPSPSEQAHLPSRGGRGSSARRSPGVLSPAERERSTRRLTKGGPAQEGAHGSGPFITHASHTRLRRLATVPTSPRVLIVSAAALLALALPSAALADNAPSVSGAAASSIGVTTIKLTGEVNPNGTAGEPSNTSWHFEYRALGAESWNSAGGGYIGEAEGSEADASVPVEALLGFGGELKAGGEYQLRLLAENGAGTAHTAPPIDFTMDAPNPPALTNEAATAVGYTKATLHATLNPEGGNLNVIAEEVLPIRWQLQYSPDPVGQGWSTAAEAFIEGEAAKGEGPAGDVALQTEIPAGTLKPGQTYKTRLHVFYASIAYGPQPLEADSSEGEFTTATVAAPVVGVPQATSVTDHSALFSGTVEVAGTDEAFDASCRFDYATDAQFQATGFTGAPQVGCDVNPVKGSEAQPVSVQADAGLEPNTTYHLRLLAENRGGATATVAASTFTTDAVSPEASLMPTIIREDRSLALRGFVNPHNSPVTECRFEYGPTTAYGQQLPCDPHPGNAVQELRVKASSGQFRLSFEGQETTDLPFDATASQVESALRSLSSVGADGVAVSTITTTSAYERFKLTFGGQLAEADVPVLSVQPGNSPLQLGEDQAGNPISSGTAEVRTSIPGGHLNQALPVIADPAGLTPGATYHFRLLATTAADTVTTEDGIFQPPMEPSGETCPNAGRPGVGSLPDCRAYEMVSPPDKNGGDVASRPLNMRTATSGDAASFSSVQGFGDDVVGLTVSTEYFAQRSASSEPGSNGWITHAISPPQDAGSTKSFAVGSVPFYAGDFSGDLGRGVFFAPSPIGSAPNVEHVANLYLRTDLRTPGSGTYDLLTACPRCAEPGGESLPPTPANPAFVGFFLRPYLSGVSPDLTDIAFESRYNLTSDAPTQTPLCTYSEGYPVPSTYFCAWRLYDWDNGTLRLAGRIPADPETETECDDEAGSPCVAADVSYAGSGTHNTTITPHIVSDRSDGHSRVFFTQPTDQNGKTASEVSAFEAVGILNAFPGKGRLFVRVDHTTTAELNASERTDCAADPTCGGDGEPDPAPAPYSPAEWADATPDGTRAYFLTSQALTDDAPVDGFEKLYMYDTTKPASAPDNLTLLTHGGNSEGVVGTSRDGSYVYLMSRGRLLPGWTPGSDWIYLWHNGDLSEIGPVGLGEAVDEDSASHSIAWSLSSREARVTPDGRHLLFITQKGDGLIGYDHEYLCPTTGGCRELYVYDADTSTLQCASCDPSGAPAKENAVSITLGETGASWHELRSFSADGTRVFFMTRDALVQEDTNGSRDVYEYDANTATVSLVSTGTSESPSGFMDASADGSNVFFLTNQQLVGWDTDNSFDLYDARIDGGFPEPRPTPAPCSGESCPDSPSSSPPASPASSAGFSGPGNLPPRRGCPPGRHRAKGHCVKRRHKHRPRGGASKQSQSGSPAQRAKPEHLQQATSANRRAGR